MCHSGYNEWHNFHASIVEPEMMLVRIPPPPRGSAPWMRIRESPANFLLADLPTPFVPPAATNIPESLFVFAYASWYCRSVARLVRRSRPSEILIYTDGACSNNGYGNSAAGCSVVLRNPGIDRDRQRISGVVSFPLEYRGPTGESYPHTSNRAELRAVIAALECRFWPGEGWKRIVIATDSEYVARGATDWIHTWLRNGWHTSSGMPVQIYDLWGHLLTKFSELGDYNIKISIWRIPRALNMRADHAAKDAAWKEASVLYTEIVGTMD